MLPFPYRDVFQRVEESLINYGARHRPVDEICASLNAYKNFAERELTDDQYFSILVMVAFYSGFRAATVTSRESVICRWFPNVGTVSRYVNNDLAAMMSDPGMIRNRLKIEACVKYAQVMKQLIEEHGSFATYIAAFEPMASFENLLLLKEELEGRFHFLGGITVYHFLSPNRLKSRQITRSGFSTGIPISVIENEKQLLKTIIQGDKFAKATDLPHRYIDIVFVAYGQVATEEFGMDRGICLKVPRCFECGPRSYCRWYSREAQLRLPSGE